MLRLHDNATSGNAYKVRLLLTQLGLGFERIEYDTDRGATRTPEFLSTKNANGRIPVLELEDGRCLPESNAILWFLAEGTRFVPSASTDRPRVARPRRRRAWSPIHHRMKPPSTVPRRRPPTRPHRSGAHRALT